MPFRTSHALAGLFVAAMVAAAVTSAEKESTDPPFVAASVGEPMVMPMVVPVVDDPRTDDLLQTLERSGGVPATPTSAEEGSSSTTEPAPEPAEEPAPPPTEPPPAPPAEPDPPPAPAPAPAPAYAPGSVEEIIARHFGDQTSKAMAVARCESRLDPSAVSPGGGNHGLFQINNVHRGTWESVTGAAWSSVYDAELNTRFAKWLYNQQGWGPWACA